MASKPRIQLTFKAIANPIAIRIISLHHVHHRVLRILAHLHVLNPLREHGVFVVDIGDAHPHGGAAVARGRAVVRGNDREVVRVVRDEVVVKASALKG